MSLLAALGLKQREIISFVGGGGKTTLMFLLADEIPSRYHTLITTTTKIYIPPADKYPTFMAEENEFNEEEIKQINLAGVKPTLGAGILPGNKLQGVTSKHFNDMAEWRSINYILVEADGSKGRPIKGHLDFEPVIPETTTLLVIVVGADALGKNLDSEYVHRPEIVAELTRSKPGAVITPETISKLITHPRGITRLSPPQARKIVILNKVDCLASLDEAYQTAYLLVDSIIDRVILCSARSQHPVVSIVYK